VPTQERDDLDLHVDSELRVDGLVGSSGMGRRLVGPLGVFATVELFALVLWLVLGRSQWFHFDEWDFLAARKAGDLGDLFRPHNEHWSTFPILSYRFLYFLVGLRSYVPYQLVVIVLHLTAAALLLVVMRRAEVNGWIAVAAASLFALFGAGYFNIVMAFQIGFTGALVLGLVHLLLADHSGPVDRRDWLGLLAGLVGLMMSGVAVTMVIVVGLAVLARRGWRVALLHTVPLAVVYLTWFFAIGRSSYGNDQLILSGMPRFVWTGLQAAYGAMGQVPGVGLSLAIVLAIGLPIAYLDRRGLGRAVELAPPVALLVGSVVFMAITATGRLNHGLVTAGHSRYIHLVAAMSLPALAVAADAFVRRLWWFLPIGLALFVVGIPGNVRALADEQRDAKPGNDATRQMILTLPHDPLATQLPRDFQPEPRFASQVTIGWLLDAAAQHRLPAAPHVSAADLAADRLRLSFAPGAIGPGASVACHMLTGPFHATLRTGDELGLHGPITITPADNLQLLPAPLAFAPSHGQWLTVLRDTGRLAVFGASARAPTSLCRPASSETTAPSG